MADFEVGDHVVMRRPVNSVCVKYVGEGATVVGTGDPMNVHWDKDELGHGWFTASQFDREGGPW